MDEIGSLCPDLWRAWRAQDPGLRGKVAIRMENRPSKGEMAECYLLLAVSSQGSQERAEWLQRARGAAYVTEHYYVHLAALLLEASDALGGEDQDQFQRAADKAFVRLNNLQMGKRLQGANPVEQLLGGLTYAFYGLSSAYLEDPLVESKICFRAAGEAAERLGREERCYGLTFGPKVLVSILDKLPSAA